MAGLIAMLVALEMLLLPAWAGAIAVRPPASLAVRLARAPAAVVVAAAVLLGLALAAGGGAVGGVLRAQAVAVGFLLLLVGAAVALERLAGPRAAQMLTTLLGWLLLAAVILAGPAVELAEGPAREVVARAAVHANPLVVAEYELGPQGQVDWLHQSLTYRLTPLGESYAYLLGTPAWWKTMLAHLFVGSALVVFSIRRGGAAGAAGKPAG